jgi:pimeloyl-ACP methyl ester carboxylesterase
MPTQEIAGIRYSYLDEGSGPLILFGHGLFDHKEIFRDQINTLKGSYRCVAVDQPGHSGADFHREGWTMDDMAEEAAELVRKLGHDKAVFVGLSQGAMVYIRLAAKYPEMVAGLVLMDTSAGPEPVDEVGTYYAWSRILRDGPEEEIYSRALPKYQLVLYGKHFLVNRPEDAKKEADILLGHDKEGLWQATVTVFERTPIYHLLPKIKAPTLIICGEEDAGTVVARSEEIQRSITGSELVVIPEAGHHAPLENPKPVTEAVVHFMTERARY